MKLENIYRDFIDAVAQDSAVSRDMITQMQFDNARMIEFLENQSEHLEYIKKRSDRLDTLFKKLSASNEVI